MNFLDRSDTIIALATPPGEGGVAILRISGSKAGDCLRQFFRPSISVIAFSSHHLYHGRIVSDDGEPIDEVLAVLMCAPHSFTREDVAEIHCHGSPMVVQRILDLFIDAGIRLARPGEFTLRAFLNGRLDLAQAEAVIDLIRSHSDAARQVALAQMEGKLSAVVHHLRDRLVDLLALVEAHIDFPEEDISPPDKMQLQRMCGEVVTEIEDLLASFDVGRTLREGLSVLIIGKPNVGKSSLLNALLGEARAIVTAIAGTTRDTIEENLSLGGVPLRLIDTAGLRETNDPIEQEGVARAREKIISSDLILLVVDGSREADPDDQLALDACRHQTVLLVINKGDLPRQLAPDFGEEIPQVTVSAHRGDGLKALRDKITTLVLGDKGGPQGRESVLLSNRRHREALVRSRDCLGRFFSGLERELPHEVLALELREALQATGEITGETTPDEILDQIFTRFCVGK